MLLHVHWGATASASELFLDATNAVLAVPAHARASGFLSFLNGTLPPRSLCNTFAGIAGATYAGWTARGGAPVEQTGLRLPVLGCSQARRPDGTYASPFLAMLAQHGFTAWTIMERNWQVAVLPGVAAAPCLQWNWTPLLPEPSGQYVIALRPSATAPWTTALLDFGAYFSTLPGAAADASATITLVTSTGLSIYANASYYTAAAGSSGEQCTLGVAALAWFSAATLDLAQQRLGLVFTRIGNVETTQAPFVFT